MDFRFSPFEILTGAGACLVCLFFVTVFSEASAIEERLATAVIEASRANDLYWVAVDMQGQTAVLSGAAPDVPAQQAAALRAAAVFGVIAVENGIEVIGAGDTCQRQLDEYLSHSTIHFKTGNAQLLADSEDILSMLAMIIRTCGRVIEIAGHTDAQGDAEMNLRLSTRRAEAVAKGLIRHGVQASKLRPRGYGETQPLADNQSAAGRKRNRRIDFRVLGMPS